MWINHGGSGRTLKPKKAFKVSRDVNTEPCSPPHGGILGFSGTRVTMVRVSPYMLTLEGNPRAG